MKQWLKSSQNPEQISNSVRGAVLGLSGGALLLAQVLGFPLTEADIVSIAGQFGAAAGAAWFFYGLAMKVVMWLGRVK